MLLLTACNLDLNRDWLIVTSYIFSNSKQLQQHDTVHLSSFISTTAYLVIIRQNCNATYAAYCYRLSSVVCRSVYLYAGRSGKTAEPIEMPFGLMTRVHGLKEQRIGWGPEPPTHGKDQFSREGRPVVKHRDILRSAVQKQLNRSICRLGYGLR